MSIEEQLLYLGLSQNEIKVYLSLLKTTGNYVSQLSKDTKIERVSLYYTLDSLKSR
jgi:sugar-specific transcriptional regulator TrmB